ncbi:MAG: H4MPT-linked C1 transfer pathway protein [Rhodocyclaceae bacterium]|nr:H4MPT-linked C1 transfer pathway protein [Rhodocyclaceae bacterium]
MSTAEHRVIGWDVGGAHVKASLLRGNTIDDVVQWPAPVWQGMEHLDRTLQAARSRWPELPACRHAITMTAEMTDLFDDRESGVAAVVDRIRRGLDGPARYYAGPARWLDADEACGQWRRVASANWLATAECVGHAVGDAVLLDIGSTTTDIVPIAGGRPCPGGIGDASRLAAAELVYVGVVRTPLCALAERIAWRGAEYNVMNELFATTADLFRITAELAPEHDQHAAADGGAKDVAGSCRRLARMIGHDGRDAAPEHWLGLARAWRQRLLRRILDNLDRVLRDHPLPPAAPIVGAGCGSFLTAELARHVGRRHLPFHRLVAAPQALAAWVDTCAPSTAVASLYRGAPACG